MRMTERPLAPAKEPEVMSAEEARSGVKGHKVRYVLAISVLIAIAGMVTVYLAAPGTPEDSPNSTESREQG
jgi:hypothetical protein